MTLYQEAGFFAFEFFWIHAFVEHGWWWGTAVALFLAGLAYARYGTEWATDLHNRQVRHIRNLILRWLGKTALVLGVILPPVLLLHIFLFIVEKLF